MMSCINTYINDVMYKYATILIIPSKGFTMAMGISSIPQALYMLGKTAIIHELFTTLFGDFDGIDALFRQWSKSVPWISDIGISDGNALISSKTFICMIKAIWAVSCPADSPVVTEAKRFLS